MYVSKYVSQFEIDGDEVLLVNALTGAVDVATADLLPTLHAGSSALPGDTLALLQKRGYLLTSAAEEQRLLKQIGDRAQSMRRGKRPREYIICPTYSCNLACAYCFERTIDPRPEVMTDDQVDRLFEAIDILLPQEPIPPVLQLFGGEPLVPGTRHAVVRIFEKARERDLEVNLVTNGVNIIPFADVIERFRDSILAFQITIDGPADVHDQRRKFPGSGRAGTFAQMAAGVDHLVKHGHKVSLRINVDRQNIDRLPELAEIIEGMRWPETGNIRCGAVPVLTHTGDTTYPYYMREDEIVARMTDMYDKHAGLSSIITFEYFRLVNRIAKALDLGGTECAGPNFHYCEACMGDDVVFGVDGYVYACPEAVAQPQFAIGRFIPKLEIDERQRALWEDRSALKIPKCRDCAIVSFCAGGCAYAALYANGNLYEPVCGEARRVIAEYAKYAMAKRAADPEVRPPVPAQR